jgi:hypothetical protein
MGAKERRGELRTAHPSPIVPMSFRLGIPWRVALQQSPPPLPQPRPASPTMGPAATILQPTAICPYFTCLSHGVHSNPAKTGQIRTPPTRLGGRSRTRIPQPQTKPASGPRRPARRAFRRKRDEENDRKKTGRKRDSLSIGGASAEPRHSGLSWAVEWVGLRLRCAGLSLSAYCG